MRLLDFSFSIVYIDNIKKRVLVIYRMILKETLREIARSQRTEHLSGETGVRRSALGEIDLSLPHAHVISGIRRCGKSTLLRQLASRTRNFCYFSFEDPRITGFSVDDFQRLDRALEEEYGRSEVYFFDEIQNVPQWERLIRSLLDRRKMVAVTGSHASLMSRELGSRLTGRHIRQELFPFSFAEFLTCVGSKASVKSLDAYLDIGGFPEFVIHRRLEILQELFTDILTRDILVKHRIRSTRSLSEMALFLLSNVGNEFTYSGLGKLFRLGSTNSAAAFVGFLEDSYLLFAVPRFAYSFKVQLVAPKKIYAIDTALARANSVSFSADRGRMLENAVFCALRRRPRGIYYYRGERECDFVVKERNAIREAFQVCYELTETNKERELEGLLGAMEEFQLNEGTVLTHHQEDRLRARGRLVHIQPLWKWLPEYSGHRK
jgi:predicted AAA+ superfamily ATPase